MFNKRDTPDGLEQVSRASRRGEIAVEKPERASIGAFQGTRSQRKQANIDPLSPTVTYEDTIKLPTDPSGVSNPEASTDEPEIKNEEGLYRGKDAAALAAGEKGEKHDDAIPPFRHDLIADGIIENEEYDEESVPDLEDDALRAEHSVTADQEQDADADAADAASRPAQSLEMTLAMHAAKSAKQVRDDLEQVKGYSDSKFDALGRRIDKQQKDLGEINNGMKVIDDKLAKQAKQAEGDRKELDDKFGILAVKIDSMAERVISTDGEEIDGRLLKLQGRMQADVAKLEGKFESQLKVQNGEFKAMHGVLDSRIESIGDKMTETSSGINALALLLKSGAKVADAATAVFGGGDVPPTDCGGDGEGPECGHVEEPGFKTPSLAGKTEPTHPPDSPFACMPKSASWALDGSRDIHLKGSVTKVTERAIRRETPANYKIPMQRHAKRMEPDALFVEFKDSLPHGSYVSERTRVVALLAADRNMHVGYMGYTVDEAEANCVKSSLEAIDHHRRAEPGAFTRLKNVAATLRTAEKKDVTVGMQEVLDACDAQFSAPTAMVQAREFNDTVKKMHYPECVPSQMVHSMVEAFVDRLGADAGEEHAREAICLAIEEGAKIFPELTAFNSKMMDIDFQGANLAKWADQFVVLESSSEFVEALKTAKLRGAKLEREAGKAAVTGKGSNRVNMMLGGATTDLDTAPGTEGNANAQDLLVKVLSLLQTGAPNELGQVRPSAGETDMEAILRRTVATVGANTEALADIRDAVNAFSNDNSVMSSKSDKWVDAHGVAGFAAPGDPRREQLHIGKIAHACGVPVPAECPLDPNTFVGFHCPCNFFRKVAEEHFYWSPQSDEFKSGKPEYARVMPMDKNINTAMMHKLGKCRRMREEAHKAARADPAKINLLQPLEKGAKDCITI